MLSKKILLFGFGILFTVCSLFAQIEVQYKCGDSNPTDNQVKPHLNLKNTGSSTLQLEDITVRYYYTKEGSAGETFVIDWAQIGGSNVTGTFHDGYLEIGFAAGAGSLSPGNQTGQILIRYYKNDWSNYNENDDYSWDGDQSSFSAWNFTTGYYQGSLVWGTEPGGATTDPTPDPTDEPTTEPTIEPTSEVTAEPTIEPTPDPTPAGPIDIIAGWIHRLPEIDYVWESTTPETEGWPSVGQTVTWQGYIRSKTAVTGVDYSWFLDGIEVDSGTTDLPADSHITVEYEWTWAFDRHELELVLDTTGEIFEESEQNNNLLIYTDAITAGFYVEQSVYDYFNANQYKLGIGSNSWEDWAQRQISRMNQMYEDAVYPVDAPDGVLDRVRLDMIHIVSDDALPLNGGLATNNPNMDDRAIDLQWGFPASLIADGFYDNQTEVSDSNPFYIEGSLPHELGHARYLVDNYGFNVHDDGTGNAVAIEEDGELVVGTDYMPFVAWDALYYTKYNGLMGSYFDYVDLYGAMAFNLIAGSRAVSGNYNAPGNIGVYLQDLPIENCVTLKDQDNMILDNADVNVYRAAPLSGVWYGKHYDNIPDQVLSSDSGGNIYLGTCPFDDDGTLDHGYGYSNCVLIIRVEKNFRVGYGFLEASDFNIEYWRGNTAQGNYDLTVNMIGDPIDPTPGPTAEPTDEPTTGPTGEPTIEPTTEPTAEPSTEPTQAPQGCTCQAGCSSSTAISVNFTQDGAGEYCFEADQLCSYINSWGLDVLEINGVDFTNAYAGGGGLPAPVNGMYYIYYKSSNSWSHFEYK